MSWDLWMRLLITSALVMLLSGFANWVCYEARRDSPAPAWASTLGSLPATVFRWSTGSLVLLLVGGGLTAVWS